MTDDLEDRVRKALSDRAGQARPEPDLDAVLAGRSRLQVAPTRPSHRADRRRTIGWLAAAAVATLVAGTAWFVQQDNGPTMLRTAADPGTPRACAVFIRPTANAEEVTSVGEALRSMPELTRIIYVTQAEAHREFATIFAERPELVASIDASALPSSWRFDTALEPAQTETNLAPLLLDGVVIENRCAPEGEAVNPSVDDGEDAGLDRSAPPPTLATATTIRYFGATGAGSSASTGEAGR